MKNIAVCLSGCGFLDGTEIHEAVCTLIALDQAGAKAVCCAPNISFNVVDHTKRSPSGDTRNVLTESARIARCEIQEVKAIKAADVDGLIFPGGFGAAANLSSFATEGPNCSVDADVEHLIGEILAARKPIGAICIAPAMLARVLGKKDCPAKVTIGNDAQVAGAIKQMGLSHCDCLATEMVCDEAHKIVTTPAYMLAQGPGEVYEGIRKCVNEVLRLA